VKRVVAVIGAGPAGLSAAMHAAESGARSILFEKNSVCGAKLLLTGGGHANLGNVRPQTEWPALFGKRGRFILPALEFLPLERYRSWLADCDINTLSPDSFHFYPESNSAKQVRDALVKAAKAAGVEIRTGQKIHALIVEDDHSLKGIQTDAGVVPADRIILCCGGKSIPATGSDGESYSLAKSAGHAIRRPIPALVGLQVRDWNPDLAGLVILDGSVALQIKGQRPHGDNRELLLTHNGFSGPAILDLSGAALEALEQGEKKKAVLSVNWYAAMSEEDWLGRLQEGRKTSGKKHVASLLAENLPKKLASWLCARAEIPDDATNATLTAKQQKALTGILVKSEFEVTGSEGWNKAIITRGGVDLSKVNPSSLESKIVPGLYFAGEMLDIDGPCGGYNLHWAFASGALAGYNAATT